MECGGCKFPEAIHAEMHWLADRVQEAAVDDASPPFDVVSLVGSFARGDAREGYDPSDVDLVFQPSDLRRDAPVWDWIGGMAEVWIKAGFTRSLDCRVAAVNPGKPSVEAWRRQDP